MEESHEVVRLPIAEALRRYPRNFLIGIGAHISDTALAYLFATFTVAYVTEELGVSRSTVLAGIVIYSVVVIALQPVYGALSDRIGRRPINIFSVLFSAAFAFPYFWLIDTGVTALIWLALVAGHRGRLGADDRGAGGFLRGAFRGARPLHGIRRLARAWRRHRRLLAPGLRRPRRRHGRARRGWSPCS